MLRHGKEAKIILNDASWIDSEIGGSQNMDVFAWFGWSHMSYCNPRPVASRLYLLSWNRSRCFNIELHRVVREPGRRLLVLIP